jgi:hypothetical protein
MRPYAFLVMAAPLVLALPAPAPAPVAAPVPKPLPVPQGVETDPITGLVSGLINGVLNIGSLESAIPAVISDLGNLLDVAGTVTRKFSTPPITDSVPTIYRGNCEWNHCRNRCSCSGTETVSGCQADCNSHQCPTSSYQSCWCFWSFQCQPISSTGARYSGECSHTSLGRFYFQ